MSRPPAEAPWSDAWVVRYDAGASGDTVSQDPLARDAPVVIAGLDGSGAGLAHSPHLTVLFAGVLTNARDLIDGGDALQPAAIVLRLFEAEGPSSVARLRGPFAVIAWDRLARRLFVARDHIGIQPLYYARGGARVSWSPSPAALLNEPDVSSDIDRVVLAEWLCGWYPHADDTAYRAIKRQPPATLTTVSAAGMQHSSYWQPSPDDGPIEWVSERDLEQFGAVLATAVDRTVDRDQPTGIFLSGGVDSIAVTVNATDIARRARRPEPIALSLEFPDAASNEAHIQKGVARQLRLSQALLPLDVAAGPLGLIGEALEMSASWPQPMWNVWAPAYVTLAQSAREHGCRTILTGRGGDEWLTVTPYLFADLVARGDARGVWRLLQTRRRSHGVRDVRSMARLLWLTAGRPLLSAALDRTAPGAWARRRRARLLEERPAWLAPDPAIRTQMDARVSAWIAPARPPQGFYVREMRTALKHPAVMHDLEETQEFGRRHGQRMLHPFWDVDLVTLLYRTPPALLIRGGQSKSLLRGSLAARLPGLGLERRTKVTAAGVFRRIMNDQAVRAWDTLGGPRTLAALGIVSSSSVKSTRGSTADGAPAGAPGRVWSVLTIESWLRRHL